MDGSARQEALERLDVLVGEWVVEADFPGLDTPAARCVFEWTLDGRFLVQRTEIPVAEAPDSMAIIAADPETGAYTALLRLTGCRPVVRDELCRRGVATAARGAGLLAPGLPAAVHRTRR